MNQHEGKLDAVFEGGGVKVIGLVGALSVIGDQGYQFVNLAGTSGGAIVATLLAAGYSTNEIEQIVMQLDMSTFTDASLLGRIPFLGASSEIITEMGMYNGDFFLKLMRNLLAKKGVHTFRDLIIPEYADDERYRFKVRVVASDITQGRMLVLPQDISDYNMQPEDLEVALAVRMSMSIPYFYKPVRLRDSYIVDGMLLSDYPVQLFDSPGLPEWPTFGFRLVNSGPPTVAKHDSYDPVSVLLAMFATAMEAQDARYIATRNFARTIAIEALHVPATAFNLSEEEKHRLYQSGVSAAKKFLAYWDFEQYKALYCNGKPEQSRSERALS